MSRLLTTMQRARNILMHIQERAVQPLSTSANLNDADKHSTKAVIFDMGGVIIPSPGDLFAGKPAH